MRMRALTFRKRFADVKPEKTWWIMLGHTDEMECSMMKPMTLEDIKIINDNHFRLDSDQVYNQATYLIDSDIEADAQASDAEIWNVDMGFLSITRINFPDTVNLREQFSKLNQYFSDLAAKSEYESITWRTYYSTELSDIVLVTKSSQLHTLSQWSLLATKTRLVGSAYTYFCIPGSLIEKDPKEWPEYLQNDCIDFMSVRFSVQAKDVDRILHEIQKCLGEEYSSVPFRVAGNEDAIICCQNVPVYNVLKLYKSWYQDTGGFLETFRDVITRIGTDWHGVSLKYEELGETPIGTKLGMYSKQVLQKVRVGVLPKIEVRLRDRAWLRPLVEMTNALVYMTNSSMLDELVFLILPAIDAFWDNVLDDSEPLDDDALYLRFAELCNQAMEHLMRVEGQLSHRPEMRPITFDLPVFVLEYAAAFLLTLSNKLSAPDKEEADQIRFLLVPSAEVEVSTEEPFQAKGKKVGLLQITVPFPLLYNPRRLFPALCHEMAHYVGETLRMRSLRYVEFLNATAIEFIDYFFESIDKHPDRFQKFIAEVYLDESIRSSVKDKPVNNEDDVEKLPLLNIVDLIGSLVAQTVSMTKYDAYAELIRNYLVSKERGAQIFGRSAAHLDAQLLPFQERLNDLLISFRETYADICMLFCLKLGTNEYLDVAIPQWNRINSGVILRIYVCLLTSGRNDKEIIEDVEVWEQQRSVKKETREWIHKELVKCRNWINDERDSAEKHLIHYLRECWKSFEENGLDCDERSHEFRYTVKEIYEKIVNIEDVMEYKEILDIIEQGRQITLGLY